jgi:Domain of unknown function (DUF5063)
MNGDDINRIVYSKSVVEFVTVANEYCSFLEGVNSYTTSRALSVAQKILPLLYLKASLLPAVERVLDDETEKFVTELDYNVLLQKWIFKLGDFDGFREVFEPGTEFSEDAMESSISENLLDIYQDMKNFISLYSLGNEEVMNDALNECIYQFREYWGQRLVNVLRAIHALIVSGTDLDEVKEPGQVTPGKDESDWLDGFFNQFRENNL